MFWTLAQGGSIGDGGGPGGPGPGDGGGTPGGPGPGSSVFDVVWPFETGSVVVLVVAALVLCIGLYYAPRVGFRLVRALIARLARNM